MLGCESEFKDHLHYTKQEQEQALSSNNWKGERGHHKQSYDNN
jgi:hypothetical protein